LPPDPILIRELKLLDRHPSNLGKESVSHARGCHDDRANALCGCIRVLNNHLGFISEYPFGNVPERDDQQNQKAAEEAANFQWRLSRYMNGIPRGGGVVYPRQLPRLPGFPE
jgi:hypothetical protein